MALGSDSGEVSVAAASGSPGERPGSGNRIAVHIAHEAEHIICSGEHGGDGHGERPCDVSVVVPTEANRAGFREWPGGEARARCRKCEIGETERAAAALVEGG